MAVSTSRPGASAFHVLIIGGGGTGGALAHDLALRGVQVTLVERAEFTSGATGRHHGLLHSGARYAVSDHASAVECIAENAILRRICPGSFEENDGLFVAITDEDMEYRGAFMAGCADADIPTTELSAREALTLEPLLNPSTRAAVRVPDATMDAMRMPLRFLATARSNGAHLRNHVEVVDLRFERAAVTGAVVRDHVTGEDDVIGADVVVNATGPWAARVAEMAGVDVPIRPSPGVMLALEGRLCTMVLNRMHPPGDGDIVVPRRASTIVGTSSWLVDDPDDLAVPEEHVARIHREGARLIPAIEDAAVRATWSAARPLVASTDEPDDGRHLSRTSTTYDHARTDGVEGFVTVVGGKATTLRAMAEACADVVCRKLGVTSECSTRDEVLLPHEALVAT